MTSLEDSRWAPCGATSSSTSCLGKQKQKHQTTFIGSGSLDDSRWAPNIIADHASSSPKGRLDGKAQQEQKYKWSLAPPRREGKEVFTTTWVTTTIHVPSQEATAQQYVDSTKMDDSMWSAPFSSSDDQANNAIASMPDDDLYHLDKHGIPDFWQRRHIRASSSEGRWFNMDRKVWMPGAKPLDKCTYRNMRPAFQLASYILHKSENWMMRLIDAPTVMGITPGSYTPSLQLDPHWKPSLHSRKKLQIAYDSLYGTMRLYTAHREGALCAGGPENPHGITMSWLDKNDNVCHDVSFNARYHEFFSRKDYASLSSATRNAVSCMYAIVLVHEMCHCLWKIRSVEGLGQGEGGITGPTSEAAWRRADTELAIVVPGTTLQQRDMGLHWEMYLLGGMLYLYTEKGIWDGTKSFTAVQGLAIGLPEGMMLINEFAEAVFDDEVLHQLDEDLEQARVMAAFDNDTGVFRSHERVPNLLDAVYDVIEGKEQHEKLRRLWRLERLVAGAEVDLGDSVMSRGCWKRWEEIQRDDV